MFLTNHDTEGKLRILLGFKQYQNLPQRALVSNIILDTIEVATDSIDYVATDTDGITATSTRTVLIETVAISTVN